VVSQLAIHADLNTKSCDLVTVYRCLSAFEEMGLVRRSFFHNGTSLYQIGDNKESVYHIVAKDTREIHEIDAATSAQLANTIKKVEDQLRADGYENVSHILEFFAKASTTELNTRVKSRGRQKKIVPKSVLN
jgi:Fur family transcriptional regulator, ferric uptake regulator